MITLLAVLLPGAATAKEKLLWLIRDLPPFTIFDGPEQGQGVLDRMLPLLIAQMPEYEHSIVRVNRARGIQMLQGPAFTCDPALLWTPERAKYAYFSSPTLAAMSSGLVVREEDQALIEPYLQGGSVDLKRLLTESGSRLGVVAERSYSASVDELLGQLPDSAFNRHYGTEATASLLQMQQLGRLRLVLGYWPEVRYLLNQQGADIHNYRFYPIQSVQPYQLLHVACSDTPLGREAIGHIDRLLPALRRDTLPGLYSHWLDPRQREAYMQRAAQLADDQTYATP
nr:TIGR02285 family protein [uncultured Pseudomonas sp.]